jgi:hypothetical protein
MDLSGLQKFPSHVTSLIKKLPNLFSGMDNTRDPFNLSRIGKIFILFSCPQFVELSAEFTAVTCVVPLRQFTLLIM